MEAALMAATTTGGGLAYVETEYWGGSGGQSAMACVAGRTVAGPSRSRGAGGPINAALQAIGVNRTERDDAFDAIGLGHRRSMADYEPDGPVRLRASQTTIEPEAQTPKTIPVWAAMLLIAGCIALGTWLAISR
jgi:hypothetical protein